jgi:hypothetical protein
MALITEGCETEGLRAKISPFGEWPLRPVIDRQSSCRGPVPGSTAASAVFIGALADEPPSNTNPPGEAPAAATATREASGS